MSFSKPPKTYAEQVAILKGRGLSVPDEARAEHCLRHHNYYRLSTYPVTQHMGFPSDWESRAIWQKGGAQ